MLCKCGGSSTCVGVGVVGGVMVDVGIAGTADGDVVVVFGGVGVGCAGVGVDGCVGVDVVVGVDGAAGAGAGDIITISVGECVACCWRYRSCC